MDDNYTVDDGILSCVLVVMIIVILVFCTLSLLGVL